jgi:hypothetical protein
MNTDSNDTEMFLRYLNGDLDANAVREIEQRLVEDNALRRQLLELSTEEAALTDWAKSEGVSASIDDDTFQGDEIPPSHFPILRPVFSRPAIGLLAAAAMVVLGLSAALWLTPRGTALSPGVALLVASTDANWSDADPEPGASLAAGKYQLTSGSVDLLFSDGAKVSVGGPAAFELKSTRHLHLESGQLVANISDEALGFTVTSPRSEVIDLGTEFGLSVDETGRTDVHVLDGLVEVLPAQPGDAAGGVTIAEGQARRFDGTPGTASNEIPVASRETLLGVSHVDGLGLRMLRGSVRITKELTASDFTKKAIGGNWIDLIAEKRAVTITEPLAVSIDSTGSYRDFETLDRTIQPGARLDSYLLHFRPGSLEQVRGVIRFDQPIMAILCTGEHLNKSDALFGVASVVYPKGGNPFRGLEPNGHPTKLNSQDTDPDWQPDEIVLSQDRHTISIGAFANTERGFDQVRILTRAR